MVCAGTIWCPSILRALYRGFLARPHRWKFLLNAPATFIESITGEAYDVEGIHDTPKPAHHSYALKCEEPAIWLLLACPMKAQR